MGLNLIGNSFKNKDLVSIDQLSAQNILQVFKTASKFKNNPNSSDLSKKIVALLFFEPSSRTFSSFNVAVKRLSGSTLDFQNPNETSSLVKGETFEDMIKVFSQYADAIVIRHKDVGIVKRAAETSGAPVINAGDGIGEHPTQALLDFYTISQKHKKTDNLRGLIVGDLVNGRTVHSLLKILSKFKNNEVFLLSNKALSIPSEKLKEYGLKITVINKEEEIPSNLNFWYWTRIQKERLAGKKIGNTFILRNELIKKYAGKNTIFMHPLPRVGEILTEVDSNKNALYLTEQIKNGVLIRMAILSLIFK